MVKSGTSIHSIENKYKIDKSIKCNWIKNEDELIQIKYKTNKFHKNRKSGIIRICQIFKKKVSAILY